MQGFMAGWNRPDHLPEMPPLIFKDETSAIRYLSDELDSWWDADYDSRSNDVDPDMWAEWLDSVYSDTFYDLPHQTAPFSLECGGWVLWVETVYCDCETDHAPECDFFDV